MFYKTHIPSGMEQKEGLWPLDVSKVSKENAKLMVWDITQPDEAARKSNKDIPLQFQVNHQDMVLHEQSFGNNGELHQVYVDAHSRTTHLNVIFSWNDGRATCDDFTFVQGKRASSSSDSSSSDSSTSNSDEEDSRTPHDPSDDDAMMPIEKKGSKRKSIPRQRRSSSNYPVVSKPKKQVAKSRDAVSSGSDSDDVPPARNRKQRKTSQKKQEHSSNSLPRLKFRSDVPADSSSKKKSSSPVFANATYSLGSVSELHDVASAADEILGWCGYLLPKKQGPKKEGALDKTVFIAFFDDGIEHDGHMVADLPEKDFWTPDNIINPRHFKVDGDAKTVTEFQGHPRSKIVYNSSHITKIRHLLQLAARYLEFLPKAMLVVMLRDLERGAFLKGVQFGRSNQKLLVLNPMNCSLKLRVESSSKKGNETILCRGKHCVIIDSTCRISVNPDSKEKIGCLVFFVNAEIDQNANPPKRGAAGAHQVFFVMCFFVSVSISP